MIPQLASGGLMCAWASIWGLAISLPLSVGMAGGIALIAVSVVAVVYVRRWHAVRLQVEGAAQRAADSERQRDSAQEELFRRLYEERELNRQRMQFEAQLSDYEKYSALAQLALGAAHEINNPLLGILSHLELELRSCQDPAARSEIEQCISGAKRISSTLRGLVNYAR